MAEPASLQEAVSWIEANVAPGATVLAPVREGKWIEGLSGRAALFSSAVRYSFRPDEWRRSLAADTLLRSGGALVNGYFFVRLTDDVADAAVPRGMAIGVNHGGEYLDLLRIAPAETRIFDARRGDPGHAAEPPGEGRIATGDGLAASVISSWSGERQGAPVSFRAGRLAAGRRIDAGDPSGWPPPPPPRRSSSSLRPGEQPLTGLSLTDTGAELTFARGRVGRAEPAHAARGPGRNARGAGGRRPPRPVPGRSDPAPHHRSDRRQLADDRDRLPGAEPARRRRTTSGRSCSSATRRSRVVESAWWRSASTSARSSGHTA